MERFWRSFEDSWTAILATLIGFLSLSLVLSGCGKGANSVPGLEKFQAGVVQSRLYVSFVATELQWDVGLTLPLPGLKDATLSLAPDLQSDGTVFQFSVALSSLLNHPGTELLSGLPDGRALPDVRGGKLPRWDMHTASFDVSLYLSQDAFAFFVPLKLVNKKGLSLPFMVSVKIEDERGNLLGKAYALPSTNGSEASGLFVLLPYIGGNSLGAQALK